jgi:myo-inositol-1(or 4)-monophosphatase
LAERAARRAAEHVRGVERPAADAWQLKGKSDFVTQVDRETEELIGEILTQGAPGSTVMGEELSPEIREAELLWVVDPVDGTTNFLHDYPAVGVSIAALVSGDAVVGVVADVTRNEMYHAVKGGGAWHGERRLAVSRVDDPANALIGTGYPFKHPHLLPAYLRQFTEILTRTSGIRRAGAASLDFVDIALGRFDGFWELYLAPWDVAAGALIVREAGGRVTDLDWSSETLRHGAFVAGNPAIHAWLMEVVAQS